jgi:hypothetical protein
MKESRVGVLKTEKSDSEVFRTNSTVLVKTQLWMK